MRADTLQIKKRFLPGSEAPSLVSRKHGFVLVVLVPTLAFYLVFSYLPILGTLAMSFTGIDTLLTQQLDFIGLNNYIQSLTDGLTWTSLRNSLYFTMLTVPFGTALALALALMIDASGRMKVFYRTAYFIPVVTSMVAVSVIWRWMYQPAFGLANQLLSMMRLPNLKWLNDPALALPAIAAMSLWKGLGFNIVIFLAGLAGIPGAYYEAASIDGANGWQQFAHITLPSLVMTSAFVIITGIIDSMQVFTQMYIMTKGGPFDSTRTIVYVIYERAFVDYRGGYASALAMILFVIIMLVSVLQLRLYRQE
jgi:multiple sugar transport system permease protein